MRVMDNPLYDPKKYWGIVRIDNVGRRPIFVSHVALRLPKKLKKTLLLNDGIAGIRLAEGDATKAYILSQEGLEEYAPHWRKIVARVSDVSGREWTSKKLQKTDVPSWAKHG
jgi:hypothetical protein